MNKLTQTSRKRTDSLAFTLERRAVSSILISLMMRRIFLGMERVLL